MAILSLKNHTFELTMLVIFFQMVDFSVCDKYQEMDAVRSQYCNYFSCMQSLLWGRLFVFSFEIYDPDLEYKHLWPESG